MENNRVVRSAMVVGACTCLSRFLGLVRDFLTAGFFGTSLPISAFVIAFRVPNLFRALFGEGALSSAFVPVFLDVRRKEGDSAAWLLARKVITLTGVFLLLVVFGGIGLMGLLRWREDLGAKAEMILPLAQIMLPYMMFICLAALSMAILNSYSRFGLAALTPSLLNIVWIGAILLVCPWISGGAERQIYGLAWGVLVAGLVQLGMQLPALRTCGYQLGVSFDWRDGRVWRVFMLMGPAALGLALTQVNVLVNSLLAGWIGSWAPAALFYAERLLYFPQGLLATAMSTVLLPVLSSHAAAEKRGEMAATVNHSLQTLFFVMAPAALGLTVLAEPIVQMIYEWHRFTPESTMLTARALTFYAPGLLVFCLAKVFVPAFYAMQDTKTPVKIGVVCVLLNFGLNVLSALTLPLYWKHAGLAFSTVISEGVNGVTLALVLRRRLPGWQGKTLAYSMLRTLMVAVVMAAVVGVLHWWLAGAVGGLGWPAKMGQIVVVLASIGGGLLVYLLGSLAVRAPELNFVRAALRRR